MKTLNKLVAVLPFKKDSVTDRPKVRGLDLTDVTVTKLIETEVVFNSEQFQKGDKLFFRSDVLRMPMSNQKLQIGDLTFILMPEELPVFVEHISISKAAQDIFTGRQIINSDQE